ncbi:MAG: T9SS type A sorting domain-containing protein [Ignavibacteriales bacterium]|nr:T9SS type A sorting domain-containing protein [Ignavibacteriales bacterium]
MKFFRVVVIIIFLASLSFSQTDTVITSLRGFDNEDGETFLFYQTSHKTLSTDVDSNIITYNLFNNNNKTKYELFKGFENIYFPENHLQFHTMVDIEFIENDPNKYIYAINSLGIDPDSRVIHYDQGEIIGLLGFVDDIFLPSDDLNKINVVSGNWVYRSFDGGYTWPGDSSYFFQNAQMRYLTFSPHNESVVFGLNIDNNLIKSIDNGKTFSIVENNFEWNPDSKLYFDIDKKHIYAITNIYEYSDYYSSIFSIFAVSYNFGEAESWDYQIISNNISICLDDSISGNIFMSKGNNIYISENYGNNFTLYTELNHHANGIYKKPNEDILFASNPNGIIKITQDSVQYLFNKSIKHSLEMYPIEVGNKWFYGNSGTSYETRPIPFNYYYSEEIVKDTVIENGNRYFYLNSYPFGDKYWLRIDSVNGSIYRRHSFEDKIEYLQYDLLASFSDETETYEGIIFNVINSDTLLWSKKRILKTYELSSLFTYRMNFSEGIGITQKLNEFDFGYSEIKLIGCTINGIVYGDTTIVGIKDNKKNVFDNFSLSQNYPNPFNPITTIEYNIPPNVKSETSNGFIPSGVEGSSLQLIVYDVLGRKVATLVNQPQKPGNYSIQFNGSNLASGIYYYQLKVGSFIQTKKMVLMK